MNIQLNPVGRFIEIILGDDPPVLHPSTNVIVRKVSDTEVNISAYSGGNIALEDISIDGETPTDWNNLKSLLADSFPNPGQAGETTDPIVDESDNAQIHYSATSGVIGGIAGTRVSSDQELPTETKIAIGYELNESPFDNPGAIIVRAAKDLDNLLDSIGGVLDEDAEGWENMTGGSIEEAGWEWDAAVLKVTEAGAGAIRYPVGSGSTLHNKYFQIRLSMVGGTAGSIQVKMGNAAAYDTEAIAFDNGTVERLVKVIYGVNTALHVLPSEDFDGGFDSYDIQEVLYGVGLFLEGKIRLKSLIADGADRPLGVNSDGNVVVMNNPALTTKTFRAVISQAGTSNPTISKSRKIGYQGNWSLIRDDVGLYHAHLDIMEMFIEANTYARISTGDAAGFVWAAWADQQTIAIQCRDIDGELSDDIMNQCDFEVTTFPV